MMYSTPVSFRQDELLGGHYGETSTTLAHITPTSWGESSNSTSNESLSSDFACVMVNDRPDVVTSHKIFAFVSSALVVIGLLGNSLSIMVFSSREMRTLSTNVYLLFLAFSDSAYLVVVFLTKILTTFRCFYFTDVPADIFNRDLVACKLLQYLLDLFSNYSACLILAFTGERFFAVYRPMAFKVTFSVKRARYTSALLLLVIGSLTAPHHFLYIGRVWDFNVCTILLGYELHFTIGYSLEVIIFRIIPVIFIAVLNVFIILNVRRVAQRHRRRLVSVASHGSNRRDDRNAEMTVMLIVVSTTYIVLFLPALVHFIIWKLRRFHRWETKSEQSVQMWQNYTKPLYIAGFAINFFLYTVSGQVFRQQLITMIRGKQRDTLSRTQCSTDQCLALVQSNGTLNQATTDV